MADFKIVVGGKEFAIPVVKRSLNEGFRYGAQPENLATGCEPRDYSVDPVEMRDSPDAMVVFDDQQAKERHAELMAKEATIIHNFLRSGDPAFRFLDQNGFPDCWTHGPAHAWMLARMLAKDTIVRLNAVAIATLIGRLSGGWSGLGMKYLRDNGGPVMGQAEGQWPEHTRNKRYDTPAMRAKMAENKVVEDWYDLGLPVYDQELSRQQITTCCLNLQPGSGDYNRYGHAMAIIDVVLMDGRFHPVTFNSWAQFGLFGMAVLYDIWPDNSVHLRTVTAG